MRKSRFAEEHRITRDAPPFRCGEHDVVEISWSQCWEARRSLDLVQQQLRTSGIACLVKRGRRELECLALIEWICGECPRQGQRYAAELGRL